MKKVSLLFFTEIIILISSCHPNRLKTDEKELAKEIRTQENNKKDADRLTLEKQKSAILINRASGFRYKEDRSVDPQNPPIKLNIPGTDNTQKIKLSDFATRISYIKLQTPPDTSLLYDHFLNRDGLMSTIISDGDQIIFQGLFGLSRFNMQGEYQETIWKNEAGITLNQGFVTYGGQDFFGVPPGNPVSLSDGSLYYDFHDGPAGTGLTVKYRIKPDKSITIKPDSEIPGNDPVPGDTLFKTNKFSQDRFDRIFGIGSDLWAGVNNKWIAGSSGALLVIYNEKGDTICQFKDYERIVNFNHSLWRHRVELESYYYDGVVTIKQEYNDTVFRLIPPDRLLPVYIFNYGDHKVSYMDGLNPNFDLSGKCLVTSLNETDEFLFIRYSIFKPPFTNGKNSENKFYALLDKKEKKIYHQPQDETESKGIVNDLDGGISFWPEFITPGGEMMKLISGSMIKNYLNSVEFKTKVITEDDREKQTSMASELRDQDIVVIIVK